MCAHTHTHTHTHARFHMWTPLPKFCVYVCWFCVCLFVCVFVYFYTKLQHSFSIFDISGFMYRYLSVCVLNTRVIQWFTFHGKNINIRQYSQTFQPNSFIPVFLTDTFDVYDLILYWSPWPQLGVTESAESKMNLVFSQNFCWSGWAFILCWNISV